MIKKIYITITLFLLSYTFADVLTPLYSQNNPRTSESFLNFNNHASRSAFSFAQDEDGFLWISSLLEVARYDGNEFRCYSLIESDMIQDSDGRQVTIREDQDGNIWAFCDKGKIYHYSADSDSFNLYSDIILYDPFAMTNDIFVAGNSIYVATSKGLLHIDSQGAITPIPEISHYCNTFVQGQDGELLVGTDRGIEALNIDTNKPSEFKLNIPSSVIELYYDKANGLIWIGTFDTGLTIFDIRSGEQLSSSRNLQIPSYPIRAITPLDSSTMLIGVDGCGVYSVALDNMTSELFAAENNPEAKIPSNKVYDILVDQDNVWIASYTAGVTLLRSNKQSCNLYKIPCDSNLTPANQIYAVLEDRDGDIWYATNMGVTLYRTREQRWEYYLAQKNAILTLAEDSSGRIYAGGYATGMYRIDKRHTSVSPIDTGSHGSPDCIYSLFMDNHETLYVGRLYQPIISISSSGERIEYPINNVNTIVEIDDDRLAIGTSNGFYIMDKAGEHSEHYFHTPSLVGVDGSSQITTMLHHQGELWFGTDGGGLCVMNLESGEIQNFSTKNGLPSNFVYSIVKHHDSSMIWGSTMSGIFCFDVKEKKHKYNILELLSESFLPASFTSLHNNSVIFGGYGGVVNIDSGYDYNQLSNNNKKITLTSLELFYKPVLRSENPEILPLPIDQVEKIKLSHNQNSLMLKFSVVDLYHQNLYYCEYFLDGFDNGWSGRVTNTINYTNLPPGSYTLNINARSVETGEVISQRTLPIIISKPLWATLGAKSIYLVTFIALMYFVLLLIKERLLRNQSRDRIKILLSVMHDIRTPLSLMLTPLNSIDASHLRDEDRKKVEMAQKSGGKFNEMVEQLLDFNKEFVDPRSKSRKDLCDVKQLLRNKAQQYEHVAQDKRVVINLELPIDNIYLEVNVASINRILDNLISNAIKYSFNDSEVIISVNLDSKKLVLSVQDFGIGIPKQQQAKMFKSIDRAPNAKIFSNNGKGMGSLFTRAFVKRVGADLSFTSQEAVGSTFSLSFSSRKFNYFSYNKTTNNEFSGDRLKTRTHASGAHNILVVDDDQMMRDYLIDNLAGSYNVIGTSSGEEALELLQRESVDLVITDLVMEGMHGNELCHRLKSNIATSHIYVILLTGQDNAQDKIKALESGANDYITKPCSIKELQLRIYTALETQLKLKQRYIEQSNLPQLNAIQTAPSSNAKEHTEPNTTNLDEKFLIKAIKIVTDNIGNNDFSIELLCQELAMSRTLVYEKLRALTHQSPSEFIRSIKLRRANELLQTKEYSVAQVAQMTGFNDVKYFSVLFKKYYKCSPSKVSGV